MLAVLLRLCHSTSRNLIFCTASTQWAFVFQSLVNHEKLHFHRFFQAHRTASWLRFQLLSHLNSLFTTPLFVKSFLINQWLINEIISNDFVGWRFVVCENYNSYFGDFLTPFLMHFALSCSFMRWNFPASRSAWNIGMCCFINELETIKEISRKVISGEDLKDRQTFFSKYCNF